MRRRLHGQLAPLILLLAGGCAQMTRHSNMMIFGTNTVVGLRVGQNATSVPEIALGYARQEAVVLPLVANTGETAATGSSSLLKPCDLTTIQAPAGRLAIHPCLLVGINGSAVDSYSVLASFGANATAKGSTTAPEATAGLAQYFATGIAAQLLAVSGGASVVSASKAAADSAPKATDATVKALLGNDATFAIGVKAAQDYPGFQKKLSDLVAALDTDDAVTTKIANFELNAKVGKVMSAKCTTKQACLDAIKHDSFGQLYLNNKAALDSAIANW